MMEKKMNMAELREISARLYGLCAVTDLIAKSASENLYGNVMFHVTDSLNRISDDFSETLDDMDAAKGETERVV